MIDWFVLLTPLLLLPVVLLFVFVGCSFHVPGIVTFGLSGDIPVPGDYIGEGITRAAIFRPTNGTWHTIRGNIFTNDASTLPPEDSITFGQNFDIPVPGDYFGDGVTRAAFFRSSDGTWHIAEKWHIGDTKGTDVKGTPFQFPVPSSRGDIPMPPGKYLGKSSTISVAVFRPSNGTWHIADVTGKPQLVITPAPAVGVMPGDIPLPGDYEGDGSTQAAIFRTLPPNRGWFVLDVSGNQKHFIPFQFPSATGETFSSISTLTVSLAGGGPGGSDNFLLPPGPYFGASTATTLLAVFQPVKAQWILFDLAGRVVTTFPRSNPPSVSGDLPAAGSYLGDGLITEAFFHPPAGKWFEAVIVVGGSL